MVFGIRYADYQGCLVMKYYAHSVKGKPPDKWQPLDEHLENVAKRATEFANPFGGQDWAWLAGLWQAESDEFGSGKDAFKIDKKKPGKKDETAKLACEKWFDVSAFGQLFVFGKGDDAAGVSTPIRGPVSIQSAFSVEPISITSSQIVKSVNAEEAKGKSDISSDRMGMKHRVDQAIYVTFGSMNPQLSERTGFSNKDAEAIKSILPTLFEGDASSARPEGSMAVKKVIWWQHNSKSGQYSSAKVYSTLKVTSDGSYELEELDDLEPKEIDGF